MSDTHFVLTVDAGQADRAIAKTREQALTMGGALEKVDRASKGANKALGALSGALGPLSQSSSAVVRGLGDVAGMLTGPHALFTAGVALAATGVVKLHEAMTRGAQEAARYYSAIRKGATDDFEALTTSVAQLEREVAQQGMSAVERRRAEARAALEDARTAVEEVPRTIAFLGDRIAQARINAGPMAALTGADKAVREESERLIVRERVRLENAQRMIPLLERQVELVGKLSEGTTTTGGGVAPVSARGAAVGDAGGMSSADARRIILEEEIVKPAQERERLLAERAEMLHQMQADAEKARTDMERAQAAERVRIAREESDAKIMQAQRSADMLTSLAVGVSGVVVQAAMAEGSATSAIAAAAIGEVARQVGGVMILKGVGLVAQGAAELASTKGLSAPVSAPTIAAGLLIASGGAAIAAGGPSAAVAVIGQLSGKRIGGGGAGGGVGGGNPLREPRARGAVGGSGQGGPAQIINVWGVDGPGADDRARRQSADADRAVRRRFTRVRR